MEIEDVIAAIYRDVVVPLEDGTHTIMVNGKKLTFDWRDGQAELVVNGRRYTFGIRIFVETVDVE